MLFCYSTKLFLVNYVDFQARYEIREKVSVSLGAIAVFFEIDDSTNDPFLEKVVEGLNQFNSTTVSVGKFKILSIFHPRQHICTESHWEEIKWNFSFV